MHIRLGNYKASVNDYNYLKASKFDYKQIIIIPYLDKIRTVNKQNKNKH